MNLDHTQVGYLPQEEHQRQASAAPSRRRNVTDAAPEDAGKGTVMVPLAGTDERALVDREDYEVLIQAGISPLWVRNDTGSGPGRKPAVKVWHGNGMVAVARLILKAGSRGRVVYGPGGSLDLRRCNISLKTVNARGEGDARTGVMRKQAWASTAKGQARKQARAAERAREDAAAAAFRAEAVARYDRWQAWIAAQVAAGRNRQQAEAEAMRQARAEKAAYCAEHGLDPATGRPPKPVKEEKGTNRIGTPAQPIPSGDHSVQAPCLQPPRATVDPAQLPFR
ncbi:hypothetical protein FFK22_009335 [Mycobacterium sp. KBS0706]|uniref:hypothetical protein n=1 Tax=Mycobacterium sp. KBS0706 TaxID=2578109 RepID=UPI00110F8D10|nr:hypothetical protein [Mycobacterium sp. KBS0706]TSD88916.1 hypothetical protein FFK22_009335 [Mycobacterium sp. KBS0706]